MRKKIILYFVCILSTSLLFTKNLPNFQLESLAGKKINLVQVIQRRTLLVFWASWCLPCKKLFRQLEKIKNRDFSVITVSLDTKKTLLLSSIKKFNIKFPVFLDSKEKLSNYFEVSSAPVLVLFTKELKVLKIEEGFTEQGLRNILKIKE